MSPSAYIFAQSDQVESGNELNKGLICTSVKFKYSTLQYIKTIKEENLNNKHCKEYDRL